jgi:hypothetical protein
MREAGDAVAYAGALRSCRSNGTIFARRSQLDAVSGYGECFLDRSSEDVDLVWKLCALFCVASLERIPGIEVVHVEHNRGSRDLLYCERNLLLHERRKAVGALATILSDLLTQRSPYAVELRERVRICVGAPALPLDPVVESAPARVARVVAAP